MSITAALHHITHYKYDKPTSLGMQTIRLRPAPHTRSKIQSYSLRITPRRHFINWQQDPFGNFLAQVVFPDKVTEFKIEVDLVTEIRVFNPFDFFLEDHAKCYPFEYQSDLQEALTPYLEIKEKNRSLLAWVKELEKPHDNVIDFLVTVNQKLHHMLSYVVRLEPGVQTCQETLQLKSGSCRDMAWFLCQALRHMGFASRFVSGYLMQLRADVEALDGPSGAESDFVDLHAWTEVYLPGAGWIGLDPTSGLFTGEGHIPLCCTPNPSSAAPVTGTFEENIISTMSHNMHIQRFAEPPRVTKPYSEQQWQAIESFATKIDEQLSSQDVRLTMGGEPTFISIDDRESDAWHFTALSDDKLMLGRDILLRLGKRFCHDGVFMLSQGKWYPGEILPRWCLSYYWRPDGSPIWKDTSLLADFNQSYDYTNDTAKTFIHALSHQLGIPQSYIQPLHEDTPHYLLQERNLPLHDEIMTLDVFKQTARKKLQSLLDQDLNAPVGFVLPLHYSLKHNRWISNRWQRRSSHMILLPGNSPVGLRLPLNSLPFPAEASHEQYPERSTFDSKDELPSYQDITNIVKSYSIDDKPFREDPNGLIHTALCAEVRAGVLYLFLPPLAWIEHFLELLVAIESVAKKLKLAVVLEGYPPCQDDRLKTFSVTPDPGVLEINVQPASDWESLKYITFTLYEEARLARLSAEKFMLDGRRVGTGGGHHIIVGAAKPEDSPFLRRPDLLRSMLTFWQHHPALSYLFAGTYIGPCSQAPRIDEARHDSLYELEIAFAQIPENDYCPPWLVDRLFRNLLIDMTGNTHRTEFCIDKLFSPDNERGRLGLLELRCFEMAPHPQMSLVQNLLIRAAIACFWRTPYKAKLIRWGTLLHDKYMLPYFIESDFRQVLDFFAQQGYPMAYEWFETFFAFRFPILGKVQLGHITIELQAALEPWPVMGEEQNGSTVSRGVDATVERLQVKVIGLVHERYHLYCNGKRIPLSPTADQDIQVAGIRYKAWSLPSSLHPKLPIDTPLVFDLVDVNQRRSVGGCTYHVAHPGGRNFERYPINENEAEGRRLARFESIGHTPGDFQLTDVQDNQEFPYTLDLRRLTE